MGGGWVCNTTIWGLVTYQLELDTDKRVGDSKIVRWSGVGSGCEANARIGDSEYTSFISYPLPDLPTTLASSSSSSDVSSTSGGVQATEVHNDLSASTHLEKRSIVFAGHFLRLTLGVPKSGSTVHTSAPA